MLKKKGEIISKSKICKDDSKKLKLRPKVQNVKNMTDKFAAINIFDNVRNISAKKKSKMAKFKVNFSI